MHRTVSARATDGLDALLRDEYSEPRVFGAQARPSGALLPRSKVLEIAATGDQRHMRADYASILQQLELSVRDLRMLRSNAAEIVVHDTRVVFDLGELKGCIFSDRVVILEAQREAGKALAKALADHISEHPVNTSAFALSAFEVVLEETTSNLEMYFTRLSRAIDSVLPALTDPSSREARRMAALSRMLPLENALSSLRLRVRRVNAILEQLLESADDIEGLCELSTGANACAGSDFALCEIAIEAYSSRLEALGDEIDSITDSIATARSSLEIALDTERNRMARMELYAALVSLPLASIGAVAGIFGMNLRSGMEEAAGVFAAVTLVTVLISFLALAACWRSFHDHGLRQGREVLDAQAMKGALSLIDTVHHITRQESGHSAGGLPELLANHGVRIRSERELEFLQALFDDGAGRGGDALVDGGVSGTGSPSAAGESPGETRPRRRRRWWPLAPSLSH